MSSTTVTGPTRLSAAMARSNSHIVSVFTAVVFVTAGKSSGDGVPSPEDVEPLATGRGPDEPPGDGPKTAQVGAVDEVGGVHEDDVARDGGGEGRLQLGFEEIPLVGDVLGR